MKIAVIQATSQIGKNDLLYKYTCEYAKDSEVINFACHIGDSQNYSYIEIALLIGLLLETKAVDFVVTGCSSGQGMMLACNSIPGVLCGYVQTPKDAFLFAQINNGNAVSLPLGEEYTYSGEENLRQTLESLFSEPFGNGYPESEAERKIKDAEFLKDIRVKSQKTMIDFLVQSDPDYVKKALGKSDVVQYIMENKAEPSTFEIDGLKEFIRKFMNVSDCSKKQVLLLGDSLRMGYQSVVSRLLMSEATVCGPAENGRWAGYTLNSLRFWIDGMPTPDVVHWNCGLWDLGDDYNLGRPFSLPEEFISALERTIAVIHKLFPNAKLIMATIMPTDNPDSGDIESYNEIIKEVAFKHDIPVDDLFPVVKENVKLIGPDHIHLTKEGYEIVGGKVASVIKEYF